MKTKFGLWLCFGFLMFAVSFAITATPYAEVHRDLYLRQFESSDTPWQLIRAERSIVSLVITVLGMLWLIAGAAMLFYRNKHHRKPMGFAALIALALANTGCYRPFQPIDLQTIATNEEGFLIPLQGDTKKQVSTASEQFLQENLVHTKQVQIPQQWVQSGYEWFGVPHGAWRPSAVLIKVDRSPVTREWTADPATGTSNKNEAVWVMTADQVEFSTGWTITARISSRDDAVKFLSNYPNGTLSHVLDQEVRAKIQSEFGIEVTDLPMEELRKSATPHIQRVVKDVRTFFLERGITITNLGITGGFIYRNPTIQEKLVEVFNAEQEKSIRVAETQAQEQQNKATFLKAEGTAKALLTERKAEADGIKMVADAKAYEISKAKEDPETYMALKRFEIEKAKLERWDGKFPTYFMGTSSSTPSLLLQSPTLAEVKAAK